MDPKPNKLINEKSPYLLQHAYNPVDWYPWCDEAFEKAHEVNKPIFLSIGYSTCHWCHVMAHESFEDNEVAALMNKAFVSIKVDREERPDLDHIYMTVCQMVTGSGGWPLTIIMAPDKRPFFVGTYIPRTGRFGRIGMVELIPRIIEMWSKRHDEVMESADKILTDWNGLMIAALARGAQVLGKEAYAEAALNCADFILNRLRDPEGRLLHRYREGSAGISGNADDYAFMVWGLIEIYEAVFNAGYLKIAIDLNRDMISSFWDDAKGGLFFTPKHGEVTIIRKKQIYDGAVPSANSVAMLNMLRLSRFTGIWKKGRLKSDGPFATS